MNMIGNLAAPGHGGGGAQILDPAIGAGTDKHLVNFNIGQAHPGSQAHIIK